MKQNGKRVGEKETVSRVCRVLAVALVLAGVLVGIMGMGTAAAQTTSAPDCSNIGYNGDGSSSNPFEVTNVSQLQCIENQDLSANYVQVSGIDASGTPSWNGGSGLDPIGSLRNPFRGTFDGAGNDITGLSINRPRADGVGLFARVGGTVTDVTLNNVDITGRRFAGGLTGRNRGTIKSSETSGTVSGRLVFAGGLVGRNDDTIESSSASGEVTGGQLVGGLAGRNAGGIIKSSETSARVDGNDELVGGFVGGNGGTIESSSASGNVDGRDASNRVGGFNGGMGFGGTITNSSASGNVEVSGTNQVGGFTGKIGRGTIINSSASGDVTGSGDNHGGLVGRHTSSNKISESYATGTVSGDSNVGGFVGNNVGTVERSYATGKVSGDDAVGGFAGKNQGLVNRTYANGTVQASQPSCSPCLGAGGLVGRNTGSSATVTESFATGDAEGAREVGGLAGRNGNDAEVTESFATGDATGSGDVVGGLIGSNTDLNNNVGGTIERSYAVGAVTGSGSNVGGVAGFHDPATGTINNSYYDNQTTGQSGGPGTPLTTDQMTGDDAPDNMIGFDFNPTWVTTDSYPELFWSVESLTLDAPGTLTIGETAPAPSAFEIVDGRTPSVTGVANYSSSDTSVITVSSPLDAVGIGNSTVTAEHFGFTDSQEVTVEPIDCANRRSLSRGEEDQECPRDRTTERGGSREELDRGTERRSDTRRRDRSRNERRNSVR